MTNSKRDALPSYGEVWLADFNPTRGHEQAGRRPALVISPNKFNHGPADLVVVLPLTTKERGIPLHVRIKPPEGGLRSTSFVMCEMIRSVSRERLVELWGKIEPETMRSITTRVRLLTSGP